MQRWQKIGIAVLAVAFAVFAFYYADLLRLNFPSPERFPVQGIDVSRHQGHISWFKASLNGVQFAYIKATEGTDFRDPAFLYNWTQGPPNQIRRGAYHFINFCKSGKEQARNFLRTVPVDPDALPPALDLEFSGNCRRVPSRAEVIREVSSFVSEISRVFPQRPVFYVTPDFYRRYFKGHEQEFPPHWLWIRNVVKEPSLTPCAEDGWIFWQYSALGRVPGIRGPVDQNVFCGTPEQLDRLTRGNNFLNHRQEVVQ
jgi:lysozyme